MMLQQGIRFGRNKNKKNYKRWGRKKKNKRKENKTAPILPHYAGIEVKMLLIYQNLAEKGFPAILKEFLGEIEVQKWIWKNHKQTTDKAKYIQRNKVLIRKDLRSKNILKR